MRRYLIEPDVHDRSQISIDEGAARASPAMVQHASIDRLTWIHSFVGSDKKRMLCVYDGPSQPADRSIAGRDTLPIGDITEMGVFDPQFLK